MPYAKCVPDLKTAFGAGGCRHPVIPGADKCQNGRRRVDKGPCADHSGLWLPAVSTVVTGQGPRERRLLVTDRFADAAPTRR